MSHTERSTSSLTGFLLPEVNVAYTQRDVALYGLAVGAAMTDNCNDLELKMVNVRSSSLADGRYMAGAQVTPLPTFASLFQGDLLEALHGVPGLEFDPKLLLHGEQEIELTGPLPPEASTRSSIAVAGWKQTSKAVIIDIETSTFCTSSGSLLSRCRSSIFLRGAKLLPQTSPGSTQGTPVPPAGALSVNTAVFRGSEVPKVLEQNEAHTIVEDTTGVNQALLYRLCGDYNPLHSSPAVALQAGFGRPILHGLCTLGFAVRMVAGACCAGDHERVRYVKARFLLHVYPGETLVTHISRPQATASLASVKIVCSVKERGKPVLAGVVFFQSPTPARL